MYIQWFTIVIYSLVFALIISFPHLARADDSVLRITLSAYDDDLPLPLEISLQSNGDTSFYKTDNEGVLSVLLPPESPERVYLRFGWGYGHQGGDRAILHQNFLDVVERYAVPDPGWIRLDGPGPVHDIDIHFDAAYTITGRVLQAGAPVKSTLSLRGYAAFRETADGAFTLVGLPRSHPVHVSVVTDEVDIRMLMTPPPADIDVIDLGDIVLPALNRDVQVRVELTDLADWRQIADCGYSVTLISADGSLILSYLIASNSSLASTMYHDPSAWPVIPEGQYFIVPCFSDSDAVHRVLDAIEGDIDLIKLGLPILTAAPGQNNAIVVSVTDTLELIEQLDSGKP